MRKKERMKTISRVNRKIIRRKKIENIHTDFAYWQTKSYQERLSALESIREEYNSWKYDNKQRFQRVYKIIKR